MRGLFALGWSWKRRVAMARSQTRPAAGLGRWAASGTEGRLFAVLESGDNLSVEPFAFEQQQFIGVAVVQLDHADDAARVR